MDDFDQLIAETLHEELGPPPDQRVWEAVRREIRASSAPRNHMAVEMLPSTPLTWLQRMVRIAFQTPLARGALTVALFGLIMWVQPEMEALWHPVITPMPLSVVEPRSFALAVPQTVEQRAAAFVRLVELDGQLGGVSIPSVPSLIFQPVPDPAALRVQVRPAQPVKTLRVETEAPRIYMRRATLSGGLRR
ncbi:MAG: hypothetical protein H6638_11870 [Ardenticatenales bacterium]|nr:hypothetical protein [Ardenticatenales bacterium]MCB9172531.1 hypothetical protein [Ardenticatenales bacterium]